MSRMTYEISDMFNSYSIQKAFIFNWSTFCQTKVTKMRVWGFGSNNAIISNVGQVFYGTFGPSSSQPDVILLSVLTAYKFHSYCKVWQVWNTLQLLRGLRQLRVSSRNKDWGAEDPE